MHGALLTSAAVIRPRRNRAVAGTAVPLVCALLAAACASPPPGQLARERGAVALGLGEVDDAADAYRSALSYDPHDPEALYGLARCHVALGDGEAALDAFASLEQADPLFFQQKAGTDYHFALYQAAQQALRRGDSTLALRRVRKLQALAPDHGGLPELATETLIAEGGRLQVAGHPDEAEALFSEALGQSSPEAGAAAAAALAEALMERNRMDPAISVLSDALLRHPDDAHLRGLMDRALEIRYPH